MASRGANGQFAPAALDTPTPDGLPPLIDLDIGIVGDPPPTDELPPPPELEPAAGGDTAGRDILADHLARGIDELVGMVFGAEYRGEPANVAAVGEAAGPVIVRALTFVHAGQVAESTIPAPLREVAVLAARVYVAWGPALVVMFQRQVAQLRAAREANDGTTARPPGPAEQQPGRAGGDNGHGLGVPGGDPAGAADHQARGEDRPAGAAPGAFAELLALDTGARRRRPRVS